MTLPPNSVADFNLFQLIALTRSDLSTRFILSNLFCRLNRQLVLRFRYHWFLFDLDRNSGSLVLLSFLK